MLVPLTPVEKGVQFFASDNPSTYMKDYDRVVKVDRRGKLKVVYNDVMKEMEEVQR
jgi:hypothetical protein